MVHVQCNISNVLQAQGKLPEVLTTLQDGRAIFEKTLGQDHPVVATTQDNIGCVLRAQGKLPEAIQMHEKALKTRVSVLGPEHLDVARTKVLQISSHCLIQPDFLHELVCRQTSAPSSMSRKNLLRHDRCMRRLWS